MYKPIPSVIPCYGNDEDRAEFPSLARSMYQETHLRSAGTIGLPVSRRPWREVPNLDSAPPSSVGSDQRRYEKRLNKTRKLKEQHRFTSQGEYQKGVDENRRKPPQKMQHPPAYHSGGRRMGGDDLAKPADPREAFKLPVWARRSSASTAAGPGAARGESTMAKSRGRKSVTVLSAVPSSSAAILAGEGGAATAPKRKTASASSMLTPGGGQVGADAQEPAEDISHLQKRVNELDKLIDPLQSNYQGMSLDPRDKPATVDGNRPFVMVASRLRTRDPRPFNVNVKPMQRWGRRPDSLFDGEGYPLPASAAESELDRRERQKKEYIVQWKENLDRKKKGKKVTLPCYANKTQTKRYHDKLHSTYALMSRGEGWKEQRESVHEDASTRREKNTYKGNAGTYFFGQPMQPEDFDEANRGVMRTHLSEAGYKGEMDWKDMPYKIDPTETPLTYIPVRVEGVVTGPESYIDRNNGLSKYAEQDCNVKRTAL
ncbi:unnamed protein product [Amoebophrya sp. A25]|nr:unnamed protein product [Amoebophrya sp. A25]|eukprot:GSA25T00015262001.1